MKRTTRTIVVMSVATVMAALASLGVYGAVKSIPVREVEVAHAFVAVAARSLPTGARITAQDVKLIAWPAESQVPGSYPAIEPLVDRGLVAGVSENEPLTDHKLAPIESGAGLPPSIPPGMRAMSVRVDEVIGVAGFVVPGTRVDVVVTLPASGSFDETMTRTVVSNVLVLTAGTRIDQERAKGGEPLPSTVITLALTPDDGERVALAAAEGKVSLALRNPLDVAPTQSSGVRVAALRGTPNATPMMPKPRSVPARPAPAPEPVAVPAPAPVPASSIYTVETIRAAERREEVVR
jgi:pilus assembly protein CpaB